MTNQTAAPKTNAEISESLVEINDKLFEVLNDMSDELWEKCSSHKRIALAALNQIRNKVKEES